MRFENALEARSILRLNVPKDHALMRRQSDRRLERAADFSDSRLQLHLGRVFDAAILDVEAVEPAAVALLVPAHVIVEAIDVVRVRISERRAKILLDLGFE